MYGARCASKLSRGHGGADRRGLHQAAGDGHGVLPFRRVIYEAVHGDNFTASSTYVSLHRLNGVLEEKFEVERSPFTRVLGGPGRDEVWQVLGADGDEHDSGRLPLGARQEARGHCGGGASEAGGSKRSRSSKNLSLIHISEPTRPEPI
eukprot:2973730-Pyramimonas_sp.AAC.1